MGFGRVRHTEIHCEQLLEQQFTLYIIHCPFFGFLPAVANRAEQQHDCAGAKEKPGPQIHFLRDSG